MREFRRQHSPTPTRPRQRATVAVTSSLGMLQEYMHRNSYVREPCADEEAMSVLHPVWINLDSCVELLHIRSPCRVATRLADCCRLSCRETPPHPGPPGAHLSPAPQSASTHTSTMLQTKSSPSKDPIHPTISNHLHRVPREPKRKRSNRAKRPTLSTAYCSSMACNRRARSDKPLVAHGLLAGC